MTRLINNGINFLQPTSLFRELILLNEIKEHVRVTQSILAKRAGIVPAMVNNYIKTFIKKGYLIVEGNNRDMRYTLTESGEKYKFNLLLSYFQETVGLYKNVKEEIQYKLVSFKDEGIVTVVLYGAAETAEITISAAEVIGLKVIGVVDTSSKKHGREFFGQVIQAPAIIENMRPDAVIITSSGHQEEIYTEIKQYENVGIKVRKL